MTQTVNSIIEIIIIVALMFLFWGEPDLFDKLRADMMGTTIECINPQTTGTEPKQTH